MGVTAQSLGVTQSEIDEVVNGYLRGFDDEILRQSSMTPFERKVKERGVFFYKFGRTAGLFVFGVDLRVTLRWIPIVSMFWHRT